MPPTRTYGCLTCTISLMRQASPQAQFRGWTSHQRSRLVLRSCLCLQLDIASPTR